jgi:CRP-like cAMP-binding protein
VRTFYLAPSGREVTLAYWFPGNFVGGPNIFGDGPHMWSSSAVQRTQTTFLPKAALRSLTRHSAPIAVALFDALAFKAKCYSALAQMMGTPLAVERFGRLVSKSFWRCDGRFAVIGRSAARAVRGAQEWA